MILMNQIPSDGCIDSTLQLLCEGYQFIQNRCLQYESEVIQTRLMGHKVLCMSGAGAAQIFYNPKYFKRKGVAPKRIQKSVFGENGVQSLDGSAHIHRKLMFMSIMTQENIKRLSKITTAHWRITTCKWEDKNRLVLFKESQKILCKIACQWAGVMLEEKEVCYRASDLGKMVDAFGGVGPRYCEGKCARKRTEKWIEDMIVKVRTHRILPEDYTALYIVSWHRNKEDKLLSIKTAAVELINILRPIVAIATYITFGALALYEHPHCRKKLQSGNDQYVTMFVQEVRRYYPFAPFVGAFVRRNFIWKRYYFKKGTRVLFDIYGTNHDSSLWKRPDEFLPERFLHRPNNSFDFVPQGGGDYNTGHRCAGELATIEIMKVSLCFLVTYMKYKIPRQNLKYSLTRIPSLPKSGFVISNIKLVN